ncbi:MAG TPA: hypothetical protein VHA10_25415 [Hypericibacter adhaerens]|uniref:Strictosidine synthase conserved region domain-containing protein n=1 Tax=Hypericibacter adhaerens TaxID=2602016 RepID=A0A5J6MSS5_9PROT|nr:strictosidine synthase [Hypericibacter adhaerens]QEX20363.1 hypothetical protein FRZ61_02800 [Hypericibacter adhaerens]HWA46583.1 hypothetical protein [Hypericibacter adhaerens]
MIGPLRQALDWFRGTGDAAITLPPMDGAIQPNQAIEEADLLLSVERPDNLVAIGGRVLFSSGKTVLALDPRGGADRADILAGFDSEVACLAGDTQGNLVAGLDDGTILFAGGPRKGQRLADPGPKPSCPTALRLEDASLIVAHGSRQNPPSGWKRDLMERNASGSVWRIDLESGKPTRLADRLAFPYGLAAGPQGAVAVSESWRHQILTLPSPGDRPTVLLDLLPGYPARLAPATGGGHWLCVFAPRSRLVEFVLRERGFCADMFREVEAEYWIAPALNSGQSFLEPLQGGAIKQLGILKPWAPSRSYGLLIRLDAAFQPVTSYHSRADGTRHGVTSCLDWNGRLLVACKGGNAILSLDPGAGPGEEGGRA